jgi:SNF2 family DNA or RNA helicase
VHLRCTLFECPNCRYKMNRLDVVFVIIPKEQLHPQTLKSQIQIHTQSHSQSQLPTELSDVSDPPIPSIRGSWGTKIDSMIVSLQSIISNDPSCKILIFAEWKEILDVLSSALQMNHITSISLRPGSKKKTKKQRQNRGKRLRKECNTFDSDILNAPKTVAGRLREFQQSTNIRVLLLPTQCGANGLNLTEANHIYFVHPLLNPAVEAQVERGSVDWWP